MASLLLQIWTDCVKTLSASATSRKTRARAIIWFAICGCLLATGGEAGQGMPASPQPTPPAQAESAELPFAFDGPPPPLPPAVIARDGSGHVTIRAVRLTMPIRLDGQLDEAVYANIPAISDFIQQEPHEGSAATVKTDVWLFFDRTRMYISFRCWESDSKRLVANEMRRDNFNVYQNDHVAFVFDTFYDRRNAVEFVINAIGGRMDGQITNERQYNGDWNPIWEAKVGRFDGGWTVEAAIPFKSLRYRPGRAQIWGFNVRRVSRWNNEWSYLTRIPSALAGSGIFQMSLAATVVGLDAPAGSRNVEIKPYAISKLTSDVTAMPRISNDLNGDVGLDVKYGITQNLTADLTYNPDFAQVEADEQQVNLTRFSLFFPEKREFFLENQGTFSFGGAGTMGGPGDTPILFYSRRIGLHLERVVPIQGGAPLNLERVVPIQGGARLTGRVGRYSLGVLSIQSDEYPAAGSLATNFSVVRLKRDFLRRSSIGAIFTGRSVGDNGQGGNATYGVDGTFAFFDNLAVNTYWAQTTRDGMSGEDTSYRAQLDYQGDRYGVTVEHLAVGKNFDPQLGFVRRRDLYKELGAFRFSPRPKRNGVVRKYSWAMSFYNLTNSTGRLETRNTDTQAEIQLQNSDKFFLGYTQNYEFLPFAFPIAGHVTLPVRGYDFGSGRIGYNFGLQRRVSGNVSIDYGTFYDGHKTTLAATSGRVSLGPRISVEPGVTINQVDVAEGAFTQRLVTSRATYTMTPLMFASALLQYNSESHSMSANVRLRWEYQPGSELFVVYNEERDTLARRFPALATRAFIVKINYLFRF
jgi:hypothetical protein